MQSAPRSRASISPSRSATPSSTRATAPSSRRASCCFATRRSRASSLLARGLGCHRTQAWGQPVVADNRAGANGVAAGEIVAKSAGDGYTLSLVAMGLAINPLLYKRLPYDGTTDFTPISLVATFPQLVLVRPSLNANPLSQLIAPENPPPLHS